MSGDEQQRVEVSASSLKALWYLCIYPHPDRSSINYWLRFPWFAIEILLLFPMGYPLLLHITDINKVTNILIIFLGIISAICKTFFFVQHRKKMHRLVQELQIVVDTRLEEKQIDGYVTANQFGSIFVRFQFFAMTGLVTALALDPIYRLVLHYHEDGFIDPTKYTYAVEIYAPFDDSNIYVYGLLSMWVVMALSLGGFAHMAINATFIGVTYNSVAALRDLNHHMRTIDSSTYLPRFGRMDDDTTPTVRVSSENDDTQITTKLLRCLHFHKQLLQFAHDIEDIFGGIFFGQILFSSLQMCVVLFDVTFNTLGSYVQFFTSLFLCSIVLTEVLVYCYFGNEITIESADIAMAIYHCRWYNYRLRDQKLVQFILHRSQMPVLITGWNMSVASLNTYTSIWNTVGSFYCLLRSFVVK